MRKTAHRKIILPRLLAMAGLAGAILFFVYDLVADALFERVRPAPRRLGVARRRSHGAAPVTTGRPASVPWHTQACASLFMHTGRREFADFAFEINDWLVNREGNA